ncbi:MAG: ribose-phosphate diphosphokinase [Acholeplasmatales bacterium]|nr:ribose-phosphate diphosphokinase [Acholeplasmatales bacterium]
MSLLLGKKVKLFALSSNQHLAEEISEALGVPLADCVVKRFADGEVNININETVRGHHVFVVQPTNNPVNENLMELLVMIDALKRASAQTINVIVPYYGYSRQDRKAAPRQAISAKLVANLIQVAGASRILIMDLHAAQIQGFFDIPVDHFEALPIFADYFKKKDLTDVVVVSPDHGGVTRARNLARALDNKPIAIIDKRRPEPNKAEVMNIIGDIQGKTCIMIDDMIDTAGSICAGAQALIDSGAKEVYACATHPIFSGPAIERLTNSPIKEVVVTNTIALTEDKKAPKIKQLSVGQLFGEGIMRIIDDRTLSELFRK